jgi:hypothetical protein
MSLTSANKTRDDELVACPHCFSREWPLSNKRFFTNNKQMLFFLPVVLSQPTCNPFISPCPQADCEPGVTAGKVLVLSPNSTTFFYLGQQLNVSWLYYLTQELCR